MLVNSPSKFVPPVAMATTPTFTSTPRARGAQPGPSTPSTSMPKTALGVLFLAAILLVSLNASPERILAALDWMASHRRESVAVFLVGYVMGVVLMLPAMLLAMSSGAIFGVAFGFLISYVGSNIAWFAVSYRSQATGDTIL